MTNITQKEIVLKQLQENGTVSRNWALSNYISRLGAIVHKLKEEGIDIVPITIDRKKDYVYAIRK